MRFYVHGIEILPGDRVSDSSGRMWTYEEPSEYEGVLKVRMSHLADPRYPSFKTMKFFLPSELGGALIEENKQ